MNFISIRNETTIPSVAPKSLCEFSAVETEFFQANMEAQYETLSFLHSIDLNNSEKSPVNLIYFLLYDI